MGSRRGSASLERGLSVLEALAHSATPRTAIELSRSMKIARPTVYRALASLVEYGYVVHDREAGRYRASFKLLDIGHRVLRATDLLPSARAALQELHAASRETVHFAVPEGGRMVYLDKLEGTGPFCMYSRIGANVPMHCTALGKAILAFSACETVQTIVATHGLPRRTPRTIVTWGGLERELARVRRRGYAVDDVEIEDDVRCVGAPIFDHRGVPVAALSISAPASRMPLARVHALGETVRASARAVSRAIGWTPLDDAPARRRRPTRLALRRSVPRRRQR